MPRLHNLKLRIPTLSTIRVAMHQPIQRLRGRAAVERRTRWLSENPLCKSCLDEGRPTPGYQVDHVIPLWKGGPDDESNLATLCRHHHASKSAKEAAERARGGYAKS